MAVPWLDLALVVALLAVNGLLAGSEMAFVSLREGKLFQLEGRGGRGARVARLARDPNRYLGAVQLGITMAGFLASATAAVSLSQPLAVVLSPLGGSAEPVAVATVTVVLALITLLFGELIPKRLSMQWAERWSMVAVRPLSVLISLTGPVLTALGWATDSVVRRLGADPEARGDSMGRDELLFALRAQLDESDRRLVIGAIEATEHRVRQVMVPRVRVLAFEVSTPAPEVLDRLREAGHRAAPLYQKDLDEPVGQVEVGDLIGVTGPVGRVLRPLMAIPSTSPVLETLRRLRSTRTNLAVVVDEHGGTAGIVTTDDIIDDLVSLQGPSVLLAPEGAGGRPAGAIVLPGSFPIHELDDVGVSLPEGRYVTVAGLVLARLGRIPSAGDLIGVSGYTVEVLAMDRLAVASVRIVSNEVDPSRP